MEELKIIDHYEQKLAAYDMMLNTFLFDAQTIACKDGNDNRLKMLDIFMEDYYQLKNNDEVYEILSNLKDAQLDLEQQRRIQLLLKEFNKMKAIPKELYLKITSTAAKAQTIWEQAKANDDYALFAPYLKEMITLDIEACKYRDPKKDCYDILLSDYEEGMDQRQYDAFFAIIKKEILPLIKKINAKANAIKIKDLSGNYPIVLQKEFIKILAQYLRFDPNWGYIGEYMHPFTNAISQDDVRITTFYREDNLIDGIFSTIHEIGHGFYEHQTAKKYANSVLANKSCALHESQSRLLENNIGRSKAFWENLLPALKALFSKQLQDIDLDDFYRSINKVECSLIRTMADELTYPLHILIRYELEKDIFSGRCDLDNLNVAWNKKVEEYLDIKVDNDRNGILQDVHWASNDFGYFPTYALGSAYAAQIYHHLDRTIDVAKCLQRNDFAKIEDWLKEHIHCYGGLFDARTILQKGLNEDFDPRYYVEYLKEKYKNLYDIIK